MTTKKSVAEVLTILDAPMLDPITVYLQDFKGKGRITVECYGKAWTTYFGAYGEGTLPKFVSECNMGYLVNRFMPDNLGVKAAKSEEAYLRRILAAVVETFKAGTAVGEQEENTQ